MVLNCKGVAGKCKKKNREIIELIISELGIKWVKDNGFLHLQGES